MAVMAATLRVVGPMPQVVPPLSVTLQALFTYTTRPPKAPSMPVQGALLALPGSVGPQIQAVSAGYR